MTTLSSTFAKSIAATPKKPDEAHGLPGYWIGMNGRSRQQQSYRAKPHGRLGYILVGRKWREGDDHQPIDLSVMARPVAALSELEGERERREGLEHVVAWARKLYFGAGMVLVDEDQERRFLEMGQALGRLDAARPQTRSEAEGGEGGSSGVRNYRS